MNAPGTPGDSHTTPLVDPLDDVFGSAPASPLPYDRQDSTVNATEHRHADLSDVPRLRSTHVTNGYREGIAASKEKHIQDGFDEGFALGAELGMKAGWCLGALEGMLRAFPAPLRTGSESDGGKAIDAKRDGVAEMLSEAEEALQVRNLFGREYFGDDGIWLYDVAGPEIGDDEEEATFGDVAEAHPVLKKWVGTVRDLAESLGLVLE